jgi:membrane-associated PAP2 superfamily phosphatase
MVDLEKLAYQIANLAVLLLLTDLAVGLLLERSGLLRGAERMSVAFAEVLLVVIGIAGFALLVISWRKQRIETESED